MNITLLLHSLRSDWNHGNAHFVRGVCRDLLRRGHSLRILEPEDAWSRTNLVADQGEGADAAYREAYPELTSETYRTDTFDAAGTLAGADLVIVHEWTDPAIIRALGGAHRDAGAGASRRRLLFHDTHHRCISAPAEMKAFDLSHYDGVLAFGEPIRQWYRQHHALPAWTWHEAADTTLFRPQPGVEPERDLVWIGNWGDDERVAELHEFLIEPVKRLGLSATVHGVRYPKTAQAALADAGIDFRGYLPNHRAPGVFARHRMTVHVPRSFYRDHLPGIPTIRPFEALACGIPLISAPWDDAEGLFRPGTDYLRVHDGEHMAEAMQMLLKNPGRRADLAANGLDTIQRRHTCRHRADELLAVAAELGLDPGSADPADVSASVGGAGADSSAA